VDRVDSNVLQISLDWHLAGHGVLLITVMRTWGSAPRQPGAMMGLRDDGSLIGSISGGCIEDALVTQVRNDGIDSFSRDGLPTSRRYGVSAEEAHRFGLPCGGHLEIVLERVGPRSGLVQLIDRLRNGETLRRELNMTSGAVSVATASTSDEVHFDGECFATVMGPRHRMLVIGAGEISAYLCGSAQSLGFEVTVCDPRVEYSCDWAKGQVTLTRAMPDDAVSAFRPDSRSAVIALTHDPKLDDLALMDALRTPAFYVAALGSRANNAKRKARLQEHFGLTTEELARLHGPAGLFIGSRTPCEIAISILAEVIAVRNGVELPDELRRSGPIRSS
jgi:xanthine dehydrogenase accessory factor